MACNPHNDKAALARGGLLSVCSVFQVFGILT
jgi:hypothetical protein